MNTEAAITKPTRKSIHISHKRSGQKITDETLAAAAEMMLARRQAVTVICQRTGERALDVAARLMAAPGENKVNRVSDEQLEDIYLTHIKGHTEKACLYVAADKLGINVATLTGRLRKAGYPYPGQRGSYTKQPRTNKAAKAAAGSKSSGVKSAVVTERATAGLSLAAKPAVAVMTKTAARAAAPVITEGAGLERLAAVRDLVRDLEAAGAKVHFSARLNISISIGEETKGGDAGA